MAKPWDECAYYVLEELKKLNDKYEGILKEQKELNKNLSAIKIKMAGISAVVAIIITLGLQYLKGIISGG